jgi:hypothetical protein
MIIIIKQYPTKLPKRNSQFHDDCFLNSFMAIVEQVLIDPSSNHIFPVQKMTRIPKHFAAVLKIN